jgi:Tfp pilus assembly protein PilN
LKRLENFLSDRLSVPVEKVDPFAALHLQEVLKNRRTNPGEDAMVFASAVGLALTPIVDKERVVNLVAPEKKKPPTLGLKHLKINPRWIAVAAGVAALVLVVPQAWAVFYYKQQADLLSQKVKDARSELTVRQSNQLELAEKEKILLEKKAALDEKLSLFRQSSRENQDFSKILAKLASLLPEEIWVTKLSFTDKKLTLVGATSKNELMVNFLENLKKPNDFSDVTFNYTQRDANSAVYSFEIMMNVK